jgi:RNA polymerase sigma-70 factor (ECF subfamily)
VHAPDFGSRPFPAAAAAAPTDDSALVARLRAGDESACESLYLAYHESLWRFAYGYVRSREVAEELVQEAFFALWRGREDYDLRTCLRAWLYGSVRNLALNHLRHERVVARFTDRSADRTSTAWSAARVSGEQEAVVAMGVPAPDAQAVAEAEEIEAALSAALAALPERRRIAMTLRWKHDLSAAEIARVLGTTPESVRVLLSRARQELVWVLKTWGSR